MDNPLEWHSNTNWLIAAVPSCTIAIPFTSIRTRSNQRGQARSPTLGIRGGSPCPLPGPPLTKAPAAVSRPSFAHPTHTGPRPKLEADMARTAAAGSPTRPSVARRPYYKMVFRLDIRKFRTGKWPRHFVRLDVDCHPPIWVAAEGAVSLRYDQLIVPSYSLNGTVDCATAFVP